MRTFSWSLALGLAGVLPALASPQPQPWGPESGMSKSQDGKCGAESGTCWGSFYGNCCGGDGMCGSSAAACGDGCQSEFGWCPGAWKRDSEPQVITSTIKSTVTVCPATTELSCPSYTESSTESSIPSSTPTGGPTSPPLSCPDDDGEEYTTPCGAVFKLMCGVDHMGGDLPLGGFYTDSWEECCDACYGNDECVGLAWHSSGPCYWKFELGDNVQSHDWTWGAEMISGCTTESSSSATATETGSETETGTATSSETASETGECSTCTGGETGTETGSYTASETGSYTASETGTETGSYTASETGSETGSYTASETGTETGSYTASETETGTETGSYTASETGTETGSYTASETGTETGTYTATETGTETGTVTDSASLSSSTSATVTYTNSSTTATATGECTTPTPFEEEGCVRCEGQPGDDQWCGYDIDTDYYQHVPITCEVRHYDLHITNTTVSPDGIERIGFLVNGQMPGPVIEANWGDWIVINVYNELENNGTTIHWHGIRQNFTNEQDGVPSITQCPIAPGESYTYRWRASQYGTSWYHSHFAIQAWEGVLGGIIIHGPHSDEYDEDAGMIFLQDWSHATVDSMYDLAQDATAADGGPRVMDNGLINGMNTWNNAGRAETVGSRYELTFVPGRKYLLRVVNISIQSTFKFYIDGHKFKVISTDFVPIVPYETDILNINIGQRYNLIVEADQEPDDYWMRSDNQQACAGMIQWNDTRAVVHYVGGPMGTPTSTGYNYTAECIDEPLASLVPIMPWNAESRDQEVDEDVTVAPNANNLFKWYLSGTTFESQWGDPTLLGIYQDGEPPSYSGNLLIEAPDANEWVYIIIQSEVPLPHPIHLHGHDFLVLGSGSGTYADGTALQMTNPPRRDTALLPTAGWLVLAFETDNPGVWLMHCHVGWHTSMGFALQIVERMDEIVPTLHDTCQLEDTCSAWDSYAEANGIEVIDSGV